MQEDKKNIPKEPGFYWAKKDEYKWFNLIVRIYGESPYFEWIAWDLGFNQKIFSNKGMPEFIFGPKIEEPE